MGKVDLLEGKLGPKSKVQESASYPESQVREDGLCKGPEVAISLLCPSKKIKGPGGWSRG